MIIVVASGKGGTGKTTVAVNMARVLGFPIQILDCDVEEPNDHLFLKGTVRAAETVNVPLPQVDEALCDACGECVCFCEYHAIVSLKGKPMVFPGLCHGCGGCVRVCPRNALREVDRRIGVVETSESGSVTLVQGRLDVGGVLAPPLIRAVKARRREGVPAILDAPPGTACPMVAALRGADFAVLVTEPTPFGLHDLKLAVETVRDLSLPFGVVVNRVGSGDGRVHDFCRGEGIPLLAEIPEDRRIAEAYSRGEMIVEALPGYRGVFQGIWESALSAVDKAGKIFDRTH